MGTLEDFRQLSWSVFKKPKLETMRFQAFWEDLELTSDSLAGPLYTLYQNGECDYVFRDPLRFPSIREADGFLQWCLSHATEYGNGSRRITPMDDREKADQEKLLKCAAGMERLSRLAYVIVKERPLG